MSERTRREARRFLRVTMRCVSLLATAALGSACPEDEDDGGTSREDAGGGEDAGVCTPGETRPAGDDCNTCSCTEDGLWACTAMACPPPCTPGESRPAGDGCNTCTCTEGGDWACTLMACPGGCTPGDTRPADDGCNSCSCGDDGSWLCTAMPCVEPCTPGETRPAGDGCNTCECVEGGGWACTEMACPPGDDCATDADCFVGGCSAQLCTPEEGAASTCEWRAEYACYQDPEITSCGCRDGRCGWNPTDALDACLSGGGPDGCTPGETMDAGDRCNTCTCMDDGTWACTRRACPDPGACDADADCFATGCSGQVCSHEEVMTDCMWLDEYACFHDPGITSCGCVEGVCSWAETDALTECLEAAGR